MYGKLGQGVEEDGPYKKAAIRLAIVESAASEHGEKATAGAYTAAGSQQLN